MVFLVVKYGCESWTVKKAEHRRIDAFELWYWRRLLRVPWTAKGSNQSILKEINSEYSLEGLMLKLKIQYFGHLLRRLNSLGRLKAGGEVDDRRQDGQMASLTQWTWVWASPRIWWRTGKPGMLQATGSQRVRHNWATEPQQQLHKRRALFSEWAMTWGPQDLSSKLLTLSVVIKDNFLLYFSLIFSCHIF